MRWALFKFERTFEQLVDVWPPRESEVALERLVILGTPWFRVMLHRIRLAENPGAHHDHPWPFFSLLLWGWYSQWIWDDGDEEPRIQTRRWWNLVRRSQHHRIDHVPRGGVVSLVFAGPMKRNWQVTYR